MKRHWTHDELEAEWRVWPDEESLIKDKRGSTRIGFAEGTYTFTISSVNANGTTFVPLEPGPTITRTLQGEETATLGVSFVPAVPKASGRFIATQEEAFDDHSGLGLLKLPGGSVLLVGGATSSCEEFDPTKASFAHAGFLGIDQGTGTSSVILADGQILIAGGGHPEPSPAVALYIPTEKRWEPTAPMLSPRTGHTLTALKDGRVLAVGGSSSLNGQPLAMVEIYDSKKGTWTSVPGSLHTARLNHTATLLADGLVLIAGGRGSAGALSTAEIFDPTTESFTPVASTMASAHVGHVAITLPSGQVVMLGGAGSEGSALPIEVFDPESDRFTSPAHLLIPRDSLAATLLRDGRVLILGGQSEGGAIASTEIFNPADNTVRFGPNLSSTRQGHEALTLSEGQVLVLGGKGLDGTSRRNGDIYRP